MNYKMNQNFTTPPQKQSEIIIFSALVPMVKNFRDKAKNSIVTYCKLAVNLVPNCPTHASNLMRIWHKKSYRLFIGSFLWALTDSDRRPSACRADALNQLS